MLLVRALLASLESTPLETTINTDRHAIRDLEEKETTLSHRTPSVGTSQKKTYTNSKANDLLNTNIPKSSSDKIRRETED